MSQALVYALTLAWQGMFGIFVVMSLIAFLVFVLSKITTKEQKSE